MEACRNGRGIVKVMVVACDKVKNQVLGCECGIRLRFIVSMYVLGWIYTGGSFWARKVYIGDSRRRGGLIRFGRENKTMGTLIQ